MDSFLGVGLFPFMHGFNLELFSLVEQTLPTRGLDSGSLDSSSNSAIYYLHGFSVATLLLSLSRPQFSHLKVGKIIRGLFGDR